MFDWNDLRYFIAVADSGSTLAAGRAMRVSQTTVARRIAALEGALALSLFERRQAGYTLTPAGEHLLVQAREVSVAATAVEQAASATARQASGVVRFTTIEIYAITVLPAILRELHEAHPTIHIELDTSEEVRDLGSGGAEIALRANTGPSEGGLVGRRIAPDPWTLYCSRGYAEARGVPTTRSQLAGHTLIGGGGTTVWHRYQAWLKNHGLETSVAMHQDSVAGLLAAVRSGVGLAVLPTFMAAFDPQLVRCLPPRNDDATSLWLLTHERVRHVPRVRLVLDFLAKSLTRLRRQAEAAEQIVA
jgi:DNA-binding transcriptional LysR family regulator